MSETFSEPFSTASSTTPGDAPLCLRSSLLDLIQSALNSSSDQFQTSQTSITADVGGTAGGGSAGGAPLTPQRGSQEHQVAPLTPLANLKVLAEASSVMEGREGGGEGGGCAKSEVCGGGGEEEGGMTAGRKMKSLSLLCKKFLSIVETSVGTGNEFSLDMMAQKLGTNRRRIYDIINVLEAVEMIVKQSKNLYSWKGRGELLQTLAKLRAMAADDTDLLQWFTDTSAGSCLSSSSTGDKENLAPPTVCVARQQGQSSSVVVMDESSQDSLPDDVSCSEDGHTRGGRWDKSLGILCQKFLMLFLIAPNHELTLDKAGSILIPDEDTPATNSKTKVRRLYDIANVLTTLELIKKKTFMAPNHRKMPGYVWCGPTMEHIDTVSVCRRECPPDSSGSGPTKKLKGTPLVRKPSFSSRPFLHQYEVKDSNSAPSTPCKEGPPLTTKHLGGRVLGNLRGLGGGSIRRSLSFGGQSSNRGCGHVRKMGVVKSKDHQFGGIWTARPVECSREEFGVEMKEFEKEMMRNSHLFPNVLAVFQDFLHHYQVSLEQPAPPTSSGRSILPRPLSSLSNFSDPLTFSTPRNPTNPPKNRFPSNHPINISTTPMADAYPEQKKQKSNKISLVTPCMRQEDSGLGDSLVGGALMTSLNDITGIMQHPSDTAETPESKQSQPKSEGTRQRQAGCDRKIATAGGVSIANDSRGSFSISYEQTQQNPKSSSTGFPASKDHVFISSTSSTLLPKQARNEQLLTNQPTHPRDTTTNVQSQESAARNAQTATDVGFSSGGGCGVGSVVSLQPEADVGPPTCIGNQQDSTTQQTHPHTEGNEHSSSPHTEGSVSVLGFTKCTLQSPQKPAHSRSQSFVRVDDFIAALTAQSREAESLLRDPRIVAKLSASSSTQPVSLLSQLLTRQLLPGATVAARKPPATTASPPLPSPSLDSKFLVNQKPISATAETKGNNQPTTHATDSGFKLPRLPLFPQPLSTQIFALPTSCGSLGFVTPRSVIATPSPRYLAPQTLLPNTTPAFVPLTPQTICLPSLSGSIPAAMPPNCCQATSQSGSRHLVSECPPLKRAKLID